MGPTILIVEDNDVVRAAITDWLTTGLPDCRVVQARSAERALALVQKEQPQAVLMDISLPGISGIEATRRIKAMAPGVPVVVLTIHEGPEYEDDAIAAGAEAYVLKRRMHAELIPILERLLPELVTPMREAQPGRCAVAQTVCRTDERTDEG